MHSWATELKRMDRALNAGLFIGALMTAAVLRYSLENMRITTTEDEDIAKPKELLDLSNWEKFGNNGGLMSVDFEGPPNAP